MEEFDWLIGMDYEEAQVAMVEHSPYFIYPVTLNGKIIVWTHDFNLNRIGIVVENNIITEVKGYG